jgi:hypothetical protein
MVTSKDGESKDRIILDDPTHGVTYTHRKYTREYLRVWLADKRWQWFIIALVVLDAILVRGPLA